MPAPLIGITGRKRSGKDTFASELTANHGYERASFADPLREAALRLDPLVGPTSLPGQLGMSYHRLSEAVGALGWEKAKDYVPEVRRTLQQLGTDAIRALDPEFWVRHSVGKLDPDVPTVFTDVRFPNEADAIRDLGGVIVRVTREATDSAGDGHPSETAMDDYEVDYEVANDYSVDELHYRAEQIADQLG